MPTFYHRQFANMCCVCCVYCGYFVQITNIHFLFLFLYAAFLLQHLPYTAPAAYAFFHKCFTYAAFFYKFLFFPIVVSCQL
ncbi:hypothetical protein BX070DRAFT_227740 [Coemansia spiralis]|nr:hypothetical protein BX070DRAFT_227740 [Coemansia spiralis]